MKLADIRIYPVKSLAGNHVEQSQVTPLGLIGDRTLMLVDSQGIFISQRKFPRMALIHTQITQDSLIISAPDVPAMTVKFNEFNDEAIAVEVWGDQCFGHVASDVVNQWFSDFLDLPLRLVNYDSRQPRISDPQYSQTDDIVSYADGFPLLVISQASLDDLNTRLDTPVTMTSFRPNIVVEGCEAYAEDNWQRIRVGEVEFDAVKRCSRCVLTTVDPDTGIKRADGQPLRALSQYRKATGGVMFGMNLIPRTQGTIKLNDSVEVLK